MRSIDQVNAEISKIELLMSNGDFWLDKENAQSVLNNYQELKKEEGEARKRLNSNATMNIFAGAGGDDAEDFVKMLSNMYVSYAEKNGFKMIILDTQESKNGYRSISYEITGKSKKGSGAFGTFINESGVHRLVRLSPFNSKHTRETSFALVDVIPFIENNYLGDISPDDLEITFTKSSGPGGQNVNKRETAVRITHIPTGLTVHSSSERNQELNRTKAMNLLISKLEVLIEKSNLSSIDELSLAGKIDNEWGNHIRSYVMHPYKMVKDLRTNVTVSNVDDVFNGQLDEFIEHDAHL